jgi:hypothetical protein
MDSNERFSKREKVSWLTHPNDFLKSFPSVTREHVVAALELAHGPLARDAHAA